MPLAKLPTEFVAPLVNPNTGTSRTVTTATELTKAITDNVNVITLNGATFDDIVIPPGKANITIQAMPEILGQMKPSNRYRPGISPVLPKIRVTQPNGVFPVSRLCKNIFIRGVEFTNVDQIVYPLIYTSRDIDQKAAATIAECATDITFTQCYIHESKLQTAQRGIDLNGNRVALINSHVGDITRTGEAIPVYVFAGHQIMIENNKIVGSGINFLIGGDGVQIKNEQVQDVVFRHNYVTRNISWENVIPVKTLFELKEGERVAAEFNVFEHTWVSGQQSGLVIKSNSRHSAANPNHRSWVVTNDILMRNNFVLNVPDFLTCSLADGFTAGGGTTEQTGNQSFRWSILNNFGQMTKLKPTGGRRAVFLTGEDRFPLDGFEFKHNTIWGPDNDEDTYQAFLIFASQEPAKRWGINANISDNLMSFGIGNPRGVVHSNNAQGTAALNSGFGSGGCVWNKNVFFSHQTWPNPLTYPDGTVFPHNGVLYTKNQVQFTNFNADVLLGGMKLKESSPHKNQATDSKDIGAVYEEALSTKYNVITGESLSGPVPPIPPVPPVGDELIDTFDRPDGELGTTSQGWAWKVFPSSFIIIDKMARSGLNNSISFARADKDLGSPNHYAEVVVVQADDLVGTCVRYHKETNQGFFGCYNYDNDRYQIYRINEGKLFLRAQRKEPNMPLPYPIRVAAVGTKIQVLVNSLVVLTFSELNTQDLLLNHNVRVGMGAGNWAKVNNFKAGVIQ